MTPDHTNVLTVRACAALRVNAIGDAGAAVEALAAELGKGPEARRGVLRNVDEVVAAAKHAGPKAEVILARSLWIKSVALERDGQFDAALWTLEDLIDGRPVLSCSPGKWACEIGLAEVRLLYLTGQFQEAVRLADAYIERHEGEGSAVGFQVTQARWVRRFAESAARHAGGPAPLRYEASRESLIDGSFPEERVVSARAAHMVLWRSLEAQRAGDVFDVLAALEGAFDAVDDTASLISLGTTLLEAADWFLRATGSFLGSDASERASAISLRIVERLSTDDSAEARRLLAAARWSAFRALSALGKAAELTVVIDDLVAMGTVAADVLGELLKSHRDTHEPQSRSYGISLALMQGVALSTVESHHAEAISIIEAAIDRYSEDDDEDVQRTLAWARQVLAQVAEGANE